MSQPESPASYVRGSSLLLSGRLLSLAINFAGQVIVVRYLAKEAYGAYAYALAVAMLVSNAVTLGFQTTIARFGPLYREQRDLSRMFGSLLFMAGAILGVGLAVILFLLGARGLLEQSLLSDPATAAVLLVFVYFIPVNALDRYLEATLAVFAGARAIFVRRHLVGPGLKLGAMLLVIATAGDERAMAWGQVVAGALGVALYVTLLVRVLRRSGLLAELRPRELRVPAGTLFGFGLPVMVSDLNLVVRGVVVLSLLEALHGTASVADYRAVIPLADLSKLVSRNFTILFIPVVASLVARGELERVAGVIRASMTWVAALTLPFFLCCFVLAEPLTVFLFGEKYAPAAPVLAALAIAYYVHAIFSVGAHALKAFGMLRWLLAIELGASLLIVALAFGWIPTHGAVGAGWAVSVGTIVQALLTFVAMQRLTGLRPLTRANGRLAVGVSAAVLALWSIEQAWQLSLWTSLPAAALLVLALLALNRDVLRIEDTFPELARLPLLGRLAR